MSPQLAYGLGVAAPVGERDCDGPSAKRSPLALWSAWPLAEGRPEEEADRCLRWKHR
jgi:hypothetical protein